MPDRLSPRAALLLIVVAFGLAFVLQARSSGGASAAPPLRHDAAGVVAAPPGLRLAAAETVPALRQPRERRRPAPRVVRAATRAPRSTPTATATVEPLPTATATPVPAAPPPVAPRPVAPRPTPVATAAPPSGEFDTTGEEP